MAQRLHERGNADIGLQRSWRSPKCLNLCVGETGKPPSFCLDLDDCLFPNSTLLKKPYGFRNRHTSEGV